MHLLPTTLGRLADLAQEPSRRWVTSAVHLRVREDNSFVAEATDTKCLLRVTGPCVAPASEFPDSVPGLNTAPNGQASALVPAAAWKKTFAAARKLTARVRNGPMAAVAVKIGEKVTTFGATNAASHQCESVENGDGKFPPTDDILDARRDGAVKMAFAVDPLILADLLRTIADTTCSEDDMRVEFEVKNPNRAITVRAANHRTGLRAHAIIMPLTAGGPTGQTDGAGDDAGEPATDVVAREKRLGTVTAERDALKEHVEALTTETIDRGDRITHLKEDVARLKELLASREDRIAELTRAAGADPFARSAAPIASSPAPARPLTRAERLAALQGDGK
jgi:hypothetical protein